MNNQDPVIMIGNLALMAGWVFMVTFAARYFFLSTWYDYRTGRALMGFMATVAAMLTYVMVAIVGGRFPFQVPIRTMLFVVFAVASGRFLVILIDAQQKGDEIPSVEVLKEARMSWKDRIKKFLRREPTLYIGLLAGVLNWLVGFNLDWLTGEQAAWWMLAINTVLGAWAAWRTRPIPPQAFTYAVTSLAGLGAAYGLDYTQEQVGQFNAMVLAVLIFLTRDQVSPKEDAPDTGVLGNKVTTD